jgi:hypothetical protein
MSAPPNANARRLTGRRWNLLLTLRMYQALAFAQALFGAAFWFLQQRKARLQDKLANEGVIV